MVQASRKPEIMGDAAHCILTKSASDFTGNFCIDDTLLVENGVKDFDTYRVDPNVDLMGDFFVPESSVPPVSLKAVSADSMTTLLYTHESSLKHDTGLGHPECAERLRAIERVLSDELFDDLERVAAPSVNPEHIELAHPIEYLKAIERAAPEKGVAYLDGDTLMSPGSLDAAYHAVGGAIDAVDKVMSGTAQNAFCAMRPPGHHAESARPMGFCIFNNVAIAANYARSKHDADRVAVVDFDVHHGNGTQELFWNDQDLLYASTHQMPLYPGTGAKTEIGEGNIFNAPLRAGDGAVKLREAFEERLLPAIVEFKPDILFVSAGFDAHVDDPLGGLTFAKKIFPGQRRNWWMSLMRSVMAELCLCLKEAMT